MTGSIEAIVKNVVIEAHSRHMFGARECTYADYWLNSCKMFVSSTEITFKRTPSAVSLKLDDAV